MAELRGTLVDKIIAVAEAYSEEEVARLDQLDDEGRAKPRYAGYQIMVAGKVKAVEDATIEELRLSLADAMDLIEAFGEAVEKLGDLHAAWQMKSV